MIFKPGTLKGPGFTRHLSACFPCSLIGYQSNQSDTDPAYKPVVLKLDCASEPPVGFFKPQTTGPYSQEFLTRSGMGSENLHCY